LRLARSDKAIERERELMVISGRTVPARTRCERKLASDGLYSAVDKEFSHTV
jgi:hypothetical protein